MIRTAPRSCTLTPIAAAVLAAWLPCDRIACAQAFDPASAQVLQAYASPPSSGKTDAARAGINILLPALASFPQLLSNPPSTGNAGFNLGTGGFVGSFTFQTNPAIAPFFANVYEAGSDAELSVLGNPVVLDAALLRSTASYTTGRNFVIGPNASAIDTRAFDLTLTGSLTAQSMLIKYGTGTLALAGSASWSAALSIGEGTVRGPAASLQTSIQTFGTLEFAQATNGSHAFGITGTGSVRKTGAGTLALGAANDYLGSTWIDEGTLALQGAGRLGGGTVAIAAGAALDLSLANGPRVVTGLAGGGNVILGGNRLDIDAASASTFAGTISGTGSLGKTGSASLSLAGSNSYTGGTVITAGTLALTGSGSLSSTGRVTVNANAAFDIGQAAGGRTIGSLEGAGAVTLGSNTLTAGGDGTDAAFSGVIAGSGGLTKTGSGTLYLGGITQHTGITTIAQGSIVARASALGPSVVNDARLVFLESRTESNPNAVSLPAGTLYASYPELYVYSGSISGSGTVVKQGSGALWLRGTSTYTGGTTVDDGLLVGNDLSLQGPIVNNAGVAFYQASDGTYSGALSGTGILLKYGPGNLTLNGTNSHTGGTGFSGLLTIADDRSLGANSAAVIMSGGTLRTTASIGMSRRFGLADDGGGFDTQTGTVTLSGIVSGPGALTKSGPGRLILGAANVYTGPTVVQAGTLQIDGSVTSSVSVAPGARITATGTIEGALALATGSSMLVRADAGGIVDHLQATSARIQGAHLIVEAGQDIPARTNRAILTTTGGVTGRFAQVTTSLALLDPVLSYDGRTVYLSLVRNDVRFQSLARSESQFGIGSALDRLVQAGDADALTAAAYIEPMTASGARAAYDSIAGVGRTRLFAVRQAGFRALTQQAGARLGLAEMRREDLPRPTLDTVRLAFDGRTIDDGPAVYAAAMPAMRDEVRDAQGHGFWMRGYGGNGRVDGTDGASGSSFTLAGVLAGYDTQVGDSLRLGALAGYARPRLTQTQPGSQTKDAVRQLAAYGRLRQGPFRIDALAQVASSSIDARRTVIVGPLVRTAAAAYGGVGSGLNAEAAYAFAIGQRWTLEPVAGIAWQRDRYDAYAETGAGTFNSAEPERTSISLRSSLGARVVTVGQWRGMDIQGELRGAWLHEWRSQPDAVVRLASDSAGTGFTVPGEGMPRDAASVGGGVSVSASKALALYADLNRETSRRQHSNTISAGLRYRW